MRVQLQALQRCPLAAMAALACMPGGAFAEGPQDSYWVELSYFYPTIDSTARLDITSTARPGTTDQARRRA